MSKSPDPVSYVVVSYFPLLTGEAGRTIDLKPDGDGLGPFLDALDALPTGGAECCLWVRRDDGLSPVFVMKRADDIHGHLVTWAEDDPPGWFSLVLMQKNGKYLMSLTPDVRKSIERFNLARQLTTGFPVPKDARHNLLFRTLHFVSGSANLFDRIRSSLGDSMSVGLMDSSFMDIDNPQSMDPEKIRWLGPFPVSDGAEMRSYFENMLDEASEPNRGPILFDQG